ncbi:hypothetical protein SKAU_G00242150 [Synaphobranchus kaupii]|uniref:Uncharacterized protein n=1 Tax=Synaphobranchus kaupii TaxID=118154 RepID=A0A9Q1F892_SYNKA|nr:hypothetical protein SKAU_G00242150 [Synaphobranchus kaupii]
MASTGRAEIHRRSLVSIKFKARERVVSKPPEHRERELAPRDSGCLNTPLRRGRERSRLTETVSGNDGPETAGKFGGHHRLREGAEVPAE